MIGDSSLNCCFIESPNHSGPRTKPVDRTSIHCMAGNLSVESCGALFSKSSRQASSQYGIGTDGRQAQFVREGYRSWCTSSSANDQRAITIEVANNGGAPDWPVSDKAYKALIKLLVDICKRHGKNKVVWFADKDTALSYEPKSGEMLLTVHRWFAAKACPGDYLFERHGAIAAEVNKQLSAASTAKPEATTQELYRVREAWDKPKTQVGAYKVLKNAKAAADKHGLSVFNSSGEKVYPESVKEETTVKPEASTSTVKIAGAKSKDNSAKSGVRFRVNSKTGLNVRTSASAKDNSNLIKAIAYNTLVTWYGYYTGDFYLVMLPDKTTGYVHKSYLTKQ